MKRFLAAFLLSGAFALASSIPNHVVVITGYETGEFAVKGAVERLLDAKIVAPIAKSLTGQNGKVVIWVTGSADLTGAASKNDVLAEKRAEQVKAYLAQKLYEAKIDANITIRTQGDELNSKMVTVGWNVELPAQAAPQKKAMNLSTLAIGVCVLVMLAAIFGIGYRKKAPRAKSQSEELSVLVEGRRYIVIAEVQNDTYVLPFPRENGSTELMTRKSRHNAKQAAKKCLTDGDPDMQALVAQRMDEGVIRKLSN